MKKNGPGFNILEIIIATAILLVAVTVTFNIVPSIYRLNQKAWNMSRASFLAQEKLDEITEKNIFIDTVSHNDNPSSLESCTRSWWGVVDPFGNAGVQVIKVKVQWKEKGVTRDVEVQGLVAP
ncbi:MAG: hypothetical protein LWY06_00950 [Firmicutes bacterium]|nr:hypothetical protein [Bacillota bacterium]